MNFSETLKVSKMNVTDISPSLAILKENNLEHWSLKGVESEIERQDSLAIVGKIKGKVVAFCIARLIISQDLLTSMNYKMNSNTLVQSKYRNDGHKKPENVNTLDNAKYENVGFENECEIYNIAVKKEYQNSGVGQLLLDKIVSLGRNYRVESIWLEVRKSNFTAIKFYKKNEFGEVSERKNFYANPTENAVVMKRNLGTVD